MRTLLVASLLASTALLHAQTSPNGQAATLEASATAPASAVSGGAAIKLTRPVTTGVTAPKLIAARPITVATTDFATDNVALQPVVVHFTVDAHGVPQNVKVVKSVNPTVDSRVVAAVSGYRYEPAKLDTWNVPMDVNLIVNFTK